MTKEYKYGNLSQDHELKNRLNENNKRSTQENIELLKILLTCEKIELGKSTLTHKEIDNVICNSGNILENKQKK